MSKVPTDYKRTYTTYDNVAVDPTDEVWVPMQDVETGEWSPEAMTAKKAEDKGQRFYYNDFDACMRHCDGLNDDE